MSSFSEYMAAKTATESARNQRDYASEKLKNAMIRERLAEVQSQYDPVDKLCQGLDIPDKNLEELHGRFRDLAFYVVVGRWR